MKKYILILGCVFLAGGSLVAKAPAKKAPAKRMHKKEEAALPIQDLMLEPKFKEEGSLTATEIANLITPFASNEDNHGKWVIFKFYDSEKDNEKTKSGDIKILKGEHKSDILKLYQVDLSRLELNLINAYNPDVNNGPMYVCYEVQPYNSSTDQTGREYIDWCLDEDKDGFQDSIFFATNHNPSFIASNINLILSGDNVDFGAGDNA